ncbi:MAG: MBL fold metallo-hydrolase [Ignavibacteriae bacterium]|nr:MBL fold metallo-hydrolase [Ignavibacteriota bacterium]
MKNMFINDVGGNFKTALKDDNNKTIAHMIWGDPVRVEKESGVKSRVLTGRHKDGGWVDTSVLTASGLLELYVIDVGQGDSVLMRTPDDEWHVIDAGIANEEQMTKRGAANFIRWKFQNDLGRPGVSLRNVVITHPDFDHYGGMLDLLAGTLNDGRTFPIEVETFWHSGLARFADEPALGKTVKGSVASIPFGEFGLKADGTFITELLDDKASFAQPKRRFESTFARLAALVGKVPKKVRRIDHRIGYFPGYKPKAGRASIRVLGPVLEETTPAARGLRYLGSESVTRNGHSVVLRVDFGKSRILLTGDLNSRSQCLLLSYQPGDEFAADVAKGCHHGSDDIDMRFVRAMAARATIISSGDNEDYAHPRPRVLGASARYGREAKDLDGGVLPPLIYSTELARSIKLCTAAAVRERGKPSPLLQAANAEIKSSESGAKFRPLTHTPISTDLIYGLINVRTDGERILCGYMKENTSDFDIQVFRAGVDA